ncbi:MAG TPA: hypothetical protein VFT22_42420 [Kofleriaceae bacterium]|nr:hypothetical protein [Kofleriaceae bacterium]
MQTSRRIILESLVGAAVVFCISLLLAPAGGTERTAHPGWLVVLTLAARYGNRGLGAGAALATFAAAAASLCVGAGTTPLLVHAGSLADLGAAMAGVLVAWVADSQQRRNATLVAQLAAADKRARGGEEAVAALTEAALALRSRADRTESSLAFLHDIALRMESPAPGDKAEAALELALARTGARAGTVQIADAGRLRTLATRGAWSFDAHVPSPVLRDRTACAALEHRRAVEARDVEGVEVGDSDMAAPILARDGDALGIIALRGVPLPAMRTASLSELSIVASWLARALASGNTLTAGVAAPGLRLADAG